MVHDFDAGYIFAQMRFDLDIDNETAMSLNRKCTNAIELLFQTVFETWLGGWLQAQAEAQQPSSQGILYRLKETIRPDLMPSPALLDERKRKVENDKETRKQSGASGGGRKMSIEVSTTDDSGAGSSATSSSNLTDGSISPTSNSALTPATLPSPGTPKRMDAKLCTSIVSDGWAPQLLEQSNKMGFETDNGLNYHYRTLPFQGIINPEWEDAEVDRFIRGMYMPPMPSARMRNTMYSKAFNKRDDPKLYLK
jgi:hypothetical protein